MNASHKPYQRYDDEFKRHAVELLESSGRSAAQVAAELGIPYQTLERWRYKLVSQGTIVSGQPPAPLSEQAQLNALRRKLAYIERERDILKKALAICSREEKDRGGLN